MKNDITRPELMYEINSQYYKNLLNGTSYTVRDKKGNEKRMHTAGLGSKDKVIEYLNSTEGLLGTITELVIRD